MKSDKELGDYTLSEMRRHCKEHTLKSSNQDAACDTCIFGKSICCMPPEEWRLTAFSKEESELAKTLHSILPYRAIIKRNGNDTLSILKDDGDQVFEVTRLIPTYFPTIKKDQSVKLLDIIDEV